jgi:LAGLIDADG-like domain/Glycosyl transferases group 1
VTQAATKLDVFGWLADRTGCGTLRIMLPLTELRQHGITAGWSERIDTANLPRTLIGQRICNPGPTKGWHEVAAKRNRPKMVYEIDDNLWDIDNLNAKAHEFFNEAGVVDNLNANIRIADAVTVTTEPLADLVRPLNPNVHVIPNYLPEWLLTHERPRHNDRITIGWGGSNTHAMDLAEVGPQLRRYLERAPANVELHIMGEPKPPRRRRGVILPRTPWVHEYLLPEDRIRWTPWNETVAHYWRAIDYDVMLAPLRPHNFNRGKCLDASTRIATRRGVIPIGEIAPGDQVWHEGGWRPVLAAERSIPRPGFLITTFGGYQIKLTPEHRMLVNGEWVTADRIRPGDVMASEPEAVGPTEYLRVPFPAVHHKNTTDVDPWAFANAEDGPKIDITPRWGRFLGAFVGDGSCGQATAIQISCDGQDQDWIDLLMDDFRQFGLNPRTEAITTYNGTVLRRRGIKVSSSPLLRLLRTLGLTHDRPNGKPRRTVRVPEVIWRSPRDVVAEFLAGYFEADGGCTSSGIAAITKDEQFARDIHRLLLTFGIEARLYARKHVAQTGVGGLYWHITLRRAAADVFAKEIGFRSERKRARLASITSKPHSNAYKPMAWTQEVLQVERCFVDPVDIQVEGEVFAAAGLVSHNSNLRVLEAAILGIPVVATDYGPYAEFVDHGVTGLLAKTDHDWGRHMRALVEDQDMREEMGANARAKAAAWTIEKNYGTWQKALTA